MPNKESFQEFSDVDTLIGGNDVRVASILNTIPDGEYAGGFMGSSGNDTLKASGIIFGLQGEDNLGGEGFSDTIFAGKDNDNVFGDAGDDFLRGDQGNDTVRGGLGNDTLYGGKNDDLVFGDEGIDFLFGGEGSDTFDGLNVGDQIPDYNPQFDRLIGDFTVVNGVVEAITTPTPSIPTPVVPSIPTPVVPSIPTPVVPVIPGIPLTRNTDPNIALNGQNDTLTFAKPPQSGDQAVGLLGLESGDRLIVPLERSQVYSAVYFPPDATGIAASARNSTFVYVGRPGLERQVIAATIRGGDYTSQISSQFV